MKNRAIGVLFFCLNRETFRNNAKLFDIFEYYIINDKLKGVTMEYLVIVQKFVLLSGGLLVFGQVASMIFGYKKPQKLANNELKDYKEAAALQGKDGLILSKNIQLKESVDFEGIGIFGPTGAGKTTKLFFTNLLSNNIKGSIVVFDPKKELFEKTSKFQQDICGRKVYRIDFTNPNYSDKYNLLENCSDTQEVLQLASNLLINGSLSIELQTGKKSGGIEWLQMSEALLSAALLYAKTLRYPYNNIEFAFQLILTLDTEQLELLFKNSTNLDVWSQYNIFKQVSGANRTEGSIKITLASNMKAFMDKRINLIDSKTTFDISTFRKQESILYISFPERKSSYYAPYIAPMISGLMDKLLDCYNNKSLPIHIKFEEFGNIGLINNMVQNSATARSRRISLMICLQSISQLTQLYGAYNAKSILNNLKTKILLPGCSDTDTLGYMSSICGDTEIELSSKTKSKGSESSSHSKVKRKMFEDGELRTLEDNRALIVLANKQPMLDESEAYFTNTRYTNNIKRGEAKIKEDKFSVSDINRELNKLKLQLSTELQQGDDLDASERLFTREI